MIRAGRVNQRNRPRAAMAIAAARPYPMSPMPITSIFQSALLRDFKETGLAERQKHPATVTRLGKVG